MSSYLLNNIVEFRPGPIMLFKLPVVLLGSVPKFSLFMLHCAQLCSIMLYKLLLPESED